MKKGSRSLRVLSTGFVQVMEVIPPESELSAQLRENHFVCITRLIYKLYHPSKSMRLRRRLGIELGKDGYDLAPKSWRGYGFDDGIFVSRGGDIWVIDQFRVCAENVKIFSRLTQALRPNGRIKGHIPLLRLTKGELKGCDILECLGFAGLHTK